MTWTGAVAEVLGNCARNLPELSVSPQFATTYCNSDIEAAAFATVMGMELGMDVAQLQGLLRCDGWQEALPYPIMGDRGWFVARNAESGQSLNAVAPVMGGPETGEGCCGGSRKRKADDSQTTVVKVLDGEAVKYAKDKRVKREILHELEQENLMHKTTSTSNTNTSAKEISTGNSKQPEQMQKLDYVHVRARRGQATDSHSLAERARREKISQRMKFLQDLVPGCSKIVGKAGMLDEIINYVQSLQRQVEFLSMKLATVHPVIDFAGREFHHLMKENMAACDEGLPMGSSHASPASSNGGLGLTLNLQDLTMLNTGGEAVTLPEFAMDMSFNASGSASSPTWDATTLQNLLMGDICRANSRVY